MLTGLRWSSGTARQLAPARANGVALTKKTSLLRHRRAVPVVVAAAPAAMALTFTPLVGLAGGAALGMAAATKRIVTGRILGISGAVKGLLTGDVSAWRVAFLAGLLGAAVVAGAAAPSAFDVLPASFTWQRAAAGGLLVGVGAALGNGCTSGHGVCGLSRLSARSAVYTLTFMAAGAAVATATNAAAALGVAAAPAPLVWAPSALSTQQGAMLLAVSALTCAGAVALARGAGGVSRRVASLAAEFAAGAVFAFGLTYGGMVRPAKVAAFLSPLHAAWDPTLAFVMGGALLISLPAYQWAARRMQAPLCEPRFGDPAPAPVDARLLAGGVIFGAGWGLSGMCPGPALVALAARPPLALLSGAAATAAHPLQVQVAAYVAAMLAGLALGARVGGGGGGGAGVKKAT